MIAALVALAGNWYTGYEASQLEKKQFESNLILKYMDPADSAKSIENIKFLIKAKFIGEDNDKIIPILKKYKIRLPSHEVVSSEPAKAPPVNVNSRQAFSAQVLGDDDHLPLSDVKVTLDGFLVKTGKDGRFELPLPRSGMVKVSIVKPGYEPIYKRYSSRGLTGLHEIPLTRIR